MAWKLVAPRSSPQTITYIPNPEFGDQEGLVAELEFFRNEDGTPVSYVKPKGGRRRIQGRFRMTRDKQLELRAFYESYVGVEILITDHLGQRFGAFFVSNPFDSESTVSSMDDPTGEFRVEVLLEFEGTKL